jgi:hypothetical protein
MTDFRDNLYIDKDHPIFRGPLFVGQSGSPTKKARYLARRDSEDAVTWSVFRTLLRIAPCRWLNGFVRGATDVVPPILNTDMSHMEIEYIKFWPHVPAPQSRLLWLLDHLDDPRIQKSKGGSSDPERLQRIRRRLSLYREKARTGCLVRGTGVLEGATELDALIEHPRFLVAVEAKYMADLGPDTKWDSEREQLGRVIDSAIELSLQQRKPSFAILVTDQRLHDSPLLYEKLAPRYQADWDFLKERLPHRSEDELKWLVKAGWVTWKELLEGVDQDGLSRCERQLLCGLAAYLSVRELY